MMQMKDYLDVLCEKVNKKNSFFEDASKYLVSCNHNVEVVALGAALYFVKDYLDEV